VGVDQVKLPLWQTDPDPKIAGRKASYVFESIHKLDHKGDKHVHESKDWWCDIYD
jgi:hypothetical protein